MLLLRLGLMTALLCHAATQHPLSPSNAGHFQGGAGCRSPSPPVPNALGRASGPAPVWLQDAAQDAPAAHLPLQAPHAGAQCSPPLSCRPPSRNTQRDTCLASATAVLCIWTWPFPSEREPRPRQQNSCTCMLSGGLRLFVPCGVLNKEGLGLLNWTEALHMSTLKLHCSDFHPALSIWPLPSVQF